MVIVIVVLFVPTVCPVGGGIWGVFGKPLKRAIWKILGLHAELTICLRFSSVLDAVCAACCLFLPTVPPHRRWMPANRRQLLPKHDRMYGHALALIFFWGEEAD